MKESDIQRKIIDYLEAADFWVVKTITTNKRGTPDIIACKEGHFYAIEVKTATGKMSQIQQYQIDKIQEAGGTAIVARSLEDVKDEI